MKTKSNLLTILPFVLLAILFLASLSAQSISNVQARQEGLEIIITYDMVGYLHGEKEIKVGYSTDGGRDYKTISGAEGDVGKNVKPGTGREIYFLTNDAIAGKNAMFKVFIFSIPPGMVYVAGGKEISSAWPEKKHGLFSYYLMKGMRGDADANKDKQITVGELGDYVKENVSEMAGMLDREQTPGLQTMNREKVLIRY